jgi:hypothetical protein
LDGLMTCGWKRAEILSAQANGVTLLVLAVWLTYEAIRRLVSPPAVIGGLVLVVALVGIVVNLAATWMISKANRTSLNVEGAFQHILTDLFAFIATAVAGLVMVLTGFTRADAIASLVVVALMVKVGIGLVRESSRIFLEAAPAGLDPNRIGELLSGRPHGAEVHDLHIWEITSGQPALSAHMLVDQHRTAMQCGPTWPLCWQPTTTSNTSPSRSIMPGLPTCRTSVKRGRSTARTHTAQSTELVLRPTVPTADHRRHLPHCSPGITDRSRCHRHPGFVGVGFRFALHQRVRGVDLSLGANETNQAPCALGTNPKLSTQRVGGYGPLVGGAVSRVFLPRTFQQVAGDIRCADSARHPRSSVADFNVRLARPVFVVPRSRLPRLGLVRRVEMKPWANCCAN